MPCFTRLYEIGASYPFNESGKHDQMMSTVKVGHPLCNLCAFLCEAL